MTARERQAIAAILRQWAQWCEANPDDGWIDAYLYGVNSASAFDAQFPAQAFCWPADQDGYHVGPTAATGLCLAAAMVEMGDSLE